MLGVEAFPSVEDKSPAKGSLSFIENVVDASTGTIMMKATFSNQDRRLWPGQFVNVTITLAVQQDVTVVLRGLYRPASRAGTSTSSKEMWQSFGLLLQDRLPGPYGR